MCSRCLRPATVCYCSALVSLETQTRIVILQHPRESGMPIGTAHMATLCLPQSSLHVGLKWDGSDALRDACDDPERPAVLLYPGPDARDILTDPPPTPVTLIVVDGTWGQARTLVRKNPELAALPRYAFEAPAPSNYRIRKEPCDEYVSTLEALMHVLGALEGDAQRFRALMRPMNAMVDAQIAAQEAAPRPRQARPKRRLTQAERLPREIRDRYDDLVLVVADASAWPHGTPEHDLGHELVIWVAHRPRTGETFSFIAAPRNPLAPEAHLHTEIPAEDLLAGGSLDELSAKFAAFVQPTDVIASWGHYGMRLFRGSGGATPTRFLDLRRAAGMLSNVKNGTLEQYAARTIAAPVELHDPPPGRAGRRLGMLTGIVAAWREIVAQA